jgi:signal transduction histidine kinase
VKKTPTVKAYLQRNILKQSAFGFVAMVLISVTVSFFLSRYKMATDLQKSATAAAEAFRSRILEGDIKAVENQIHDVLGLGTGEQAFILNREFKHIYKSTGVEQQSISHCEPIGIPCFDSYTGPGQLLLPIYFDSKKENLFGFLYLSKSVQIDWIYVFIVFSIFSIGYVALLFGLTNVTRASSGKLASEVEEWALRLKRNPKDKNPLSEAPFAELSPLKEAIEGLTEQIEVYEDKAGQRAKMLVLRGIAHDLLSPVSQVQLYIATLEKQLHLDPSAEETLAEIKDSLQKVSMVASQVKALNESSDAAENIDLTATTKIEVASLQKSERIADKKIQLDLSLEKDDELLAPLSRAEVARILQNLVENAADASAPGARIQIALSSQGGKSLLSVRDTGHGIPVHLQGRVFEPDFTSKPSTGTGLGLFIVKHICEQKNGSVELSSVPDEGTTVTVSIPSVTEAGGLHAI